MAEGNPAFSVWPEVGTAPALTRKTICGTWDNWERRLHATYKAQGLRTLTTDAGRGPGDRAAETWAEDTASPKGSGRECRGLRQLEPARA